MEVCRSAIVFSRASSAGVVPHLLCMTGRRRMKVGFEHEKNVTPVVREHMAGNSGIRLNRIP